MAKHPQPVTTFDFEVVKFWPETLELNVPSHVPEGVARAFLQAERNFEVKGNEEAAGAMYRRTLERALQHKYPDVTGTLYARVNSLVAAHVLTAELGEWAHQIRLIGNEAVHEDEPVDPTDLTAMRGFVEAVLRYLFTLPGEVARRRKGEQPQTG